MRYLISFLLLFLFTHDILAQKKKEKKLSDKEAREVLQAFQPDSLEAVRAASGIACKCIDSISLIGKGSQEVAGEISECIHKSVMSYQILSQSMRIFTDTAKTITINISENRDSKMYQRDYYEIERYMRDSCPSLRSAVASNNAESRHSVSDNPKALRYYSDGIRAMEDKKYEDAAALYRKALAEDPKFAFAWDNLGICYRRMGKLPEALAAYQKSLELDPGGQTPLQNIPVVYEYQKEYNKALAAYKNLIRAYKSDPEGYYGLGRMYVYLNDFENALHNICIAYGLYAEMQSPYRTDAENMMAAIYQHMKKNGEEKKFDAILKEHNIATQ